MRLEENSKQKVNQKQLKQINEEFMRSLPNPAERTQLCRLFLHELTTIESVSPKFCRDSQFQ